MVEQLDFGFADEYAEMLDVQPTEGGPEPTKEEYERRFAEVSTQLRVDLAARAQRIVNTYLLVTRRDPDSYVEYVAFGQAVAEGALLWLLATERTRLEPQWANDEEEVALSLAPTPKNEDSTIGSGRGYL